MFEERQVRVYVIVSCIFRGIKPNPAKIAAISNMPNPNDKSAVRRLLGMVNFLANHIPNVSSITAPLRDLVKNDVHFQWGPEQDL